MKGKKSRMKTKETHRDVKGVQKSQDIRLMVKKRKREALIQDAAMLGFLACILTGGALLAAAEGSGQAENAVMFMAMGAGVIFAAYRFQYLAVVLGALETFFYVVYKVYRALTEGVSVAWYSYMWLFLPLACISCLLLFLRSSYRVETEMEKMDAQIREMVLLEPITGLYNLKSMYVDLERQIAYSKRNQLPLSLLLIELRYSKELQAILTHVQFDMLKKRLAEYVEDRIRLEDRIYAIDGDGSLGIICTCDRAGVEVIKGRIKKALLEKAFFSGITDKAVRIEIKTGCYEYGAEITSAMELKQKAENELQYDV